MFLIWCSEPSSSLLHFLSIFFFLEVLLYCCCCCCYINNRFAYHCSWGNEMNESSFGPEFDSVGRAHVWKLYLTARTHETNDNIDNDDKSDDECDGDKKKVVKTKTEGKKNWSEEVFLSEYSFSVSDFIIRYCNMCVWWCRCYTLFSRPHTHTLFCMLYSVGMFCWFVYLRAREEKIHATTKYILELMINMQECEKRTQKRA